MSQQCVLPVQKVKLILEGDSAHVTPTGSAASGPGVLNTRCEPAGMGPEEGQEDGWKAGSLLLRGQAERVDTVQSGKNQTPGKACCGLPLLKGDL